MHGHGTKGPATPANEIVLDISRTLYRRHPPTGIDQVEAAYIDTLGASYGAWLGGQFVRLTDLPKSGGFDLRAVMQPWRDRRFRVAETAIRRFRDPAPSPSNVYVNVGHSNLDRLATAPSPRIVMIHDTIPLDHPDWQRPESVARFRAGLAATSAHADAIIAPSSATAARLTQWLDQFGRVPPIHVAPLAARSLPDMPAIQRARPFMLVLGTLEPRKNLGFILDVWEHLGPTAPDLVLIGRRGWESPEFFQRLDQAKESGRVHELGFQDDATVAAYLKGAQALLFPTLAEGFGLPLLEASAFGTPIIASDLPVVREVAPTSCLISPNDITAWAAEITNPWRALGEQKATMCECNNSRNEWNAHFDEVLRIAREIM